MPLKKGSSRATVSEYDLAYIAGIFDGEGCVNFCRLRKGYFIRVMIVNTNRELLEYIQGLFCGDIKPVKRKAGWKQSWIWRLSWTRAIEFLDMIEPWLRVKEDQAHLAFCWNHFRLGRGKPTQERKDEYYNVCNYIKECMTYFNHRGEHNLEDPVRRELCLL